MRLLFAFVNRWVSTPGQWGVCDCALGLADWYHAVHGEDPAKHLRGAYFDATSCHQLTGWFRDPVPVIEGCLETVGGLDRVTTPSLGDVAVIKAAHDGRVVPLGAIWTGQEWVAKSVEDHGAPGVGVISISPRATQPLAIWGVGYA